MSDWAGEWASKELSGYQRYKESEQMRKDHKKALARIAKLEAALKSIADNTCCESCREAALVASKALEE